MPLISGVFARGGFRASPSTNLRPNKSWTAAACEFLIKVHEAMYVPALKAYLQNRIATGAPVRFDVYMKHMMTAHSAVEDVGRIAQQAGVKTLVLSHLTPGIDGIEDKTWRAEAAKHFTGEIVVARDLMVL